MFFWMSWVQLNSPVNEKIDLAGPDPIPFVPHLTAQLKKKEKK